MPRITIVNDQDEVIGALPKQEARRRGEFHRLSHIAICNSKGEMLLQYRSATKQDSPDKWTFAVGGHVDDGESYEQAALREAREELGFTGLELTELFNFYTERQAGDSAIRRFNQLYYAVTDQVPTPDPEEVADARWHTLSQIDKMIDLSPKLFTETFVVQFPTLRDLLS